MNRLKDIWRTAPVTILVTGLCIALFVLVTLHPLGLDSLHAALLAGAYYKPFILAGEWWRMVVYGLLHIQLWHLLMNLYSFFNLGPVMERQLGRVRYLIVLFGSMLGGSMLIFAQSGNSITVGLSAGLYGLMAGFFVLVIKSGGLSIPQYRNMMLQMLAVNAAINLLPNISVWGHAGGFVTGAFLTEILVRDNNKSLRQNCAAAFAILLVIVGVKMNLSRNIRPEEQYLGTDAVLLEAEEKLGFATHAEKTALRLIDLYGLKPEEGGQKK